MSLSSSTSSHQGFCPVPFLQESTFPETGGFISGRFCAPIPQLQNITCCLPCPMTQWTYADGFEARTEIANWVNVATLIFCVFLLASFAVLPVKWTHRHYLGVCLTIAVVFMELAFIIPLAARPEQCYNEITPNDMKSSGTCAISGAFLLFGGWGAVVWVFLRALSIHLQICWEMVPGNRFFYTSLVVGWLIPAIALTLTLSLTGVSFRFGNVCHVNHKLALQNFWGPMLAFAALALVLQFITLGYCVHVYIKSVVTEGNTTNSSGRAPTYSGSISTASARATYRRVKRVIELQWRGATIVLLIIGEVAFFSIVFVSMDNSSQMSDELLQRSMPWLMCLFSAQGDQNQCLDLVGDMVQSEGVVLAVLIVLGLSGFWSLLFFGRWSMVLGWIDLIKSKTKKQNEFVSADARRHSTDPRTYEMLSGTQPLNMKSPDRALDRTLSQRQSRPFKSPLERNSVTFAIDGDIKHDSYGNYGQTRTYVSPVSSYSTPRPPSSGAGREWDPKATHATSTELPLPPYSKRKEWGD